VSVDGQAAHTNPTVKATICLVNLFASTPPLDRSRMSNIGSVLAKKHLFVEQSASECPEIIFWEMDAAACSEYPAGQRSVAPPGVCLWAYSRPTRNIQRLAAFPNRNRSKAAGSTLQS